MKLSELLSTYFPQILVVVGGFTYFIKRKFDLAAKKVETRHAIFQQSKIEVIKSYYNSYTKCERAISLISPGKLIVQGYSANELDEITKECISNLLADDLTLTLYFEKEILSDFNLVTKNLLNIHGAYQDVFLGIRPKDVATSASNNLFGEFVKVRKENNLILEELGKKIRKTFNDE